MNRPMAFVAALMVLGTQAALGQFIPDPAGNGGGDIGGPIGIYDCEGQREDDYTWAEIEYQNNIIDANNAYNSAVSDAWNTFTSTVNEPGCGFFCMQEALQTYNSQVALAESIRNIAYANAQAWYDARIAAANAAYEECDRLRHLV